VARAIRTRASIQVFGQSAIIKTNAIYFSDIERRPTVQITSVDIQLQSTHEQSIRLTQSATLKAWTGTRPGSDSANQTAQAPTSFVVQLFDQGTRALSGETQGDAGGSRRAASEPGAAAAQDHRRDHAGREDQSDLGV